MNKVPQKIFFPYFDLNETLDLKRNWEERRGRL